MMPYVVRERYPLRVPIESSARTFAVADLHNTAASQQENIIGRFRRYTEEDLRMFADEDELNPERAQRLRAFLQEE